MNTIADALVAALQQAGATQIFGVPGGDSSLDLIEAARRHSLAFVLARTECAAVLMAAAATEAGTPLGVALTTKGPGIASAINGIAHADLDRSPVVVISDTFEPEHRAYVTHQWIDQPALTRPLVRAHTALEGDDPVGAFSRAIDAALGPRRGPVHVELSGAIARSPASRAPGDAAPGFAAPEQADAAALGEARALLARSRRAVVVAGLECAHAAAAGALRTLVERLGCPAMVTYKGKGAIADDSPQFAGLFTGGAAEAPVFEGCDLIVLAGVDPVELIPQPWRYQAPVLEVGRAAHPVHYLRASVALRGDIAANLQAIAGDARRGHWRRPEIGAHRQRMRSMFRLGQGEAAQGAPGVRPREAVSLAPHQVVETVARAAARIAARTMRPRARVTVDAGAHMFATTALWPCAEPGDLLISNGLATMGFALPAAIGAALADSSRPVIAFTGDGGLAMCLGELGTAVEQRAPVIVIVFNDAALSLIDIKQQQRALPSTGVRTREADFRGVMRALGGRAWRAGTQASLRAAVNRAHDAVARGLGPCLIDVRVDPAGYRAQMRALRG